jgi:hypothetical protein
MLGPLLIQGSLRVEGRAESKRTFRPVDAEIRLQDEAAHHGNPEPHESLVPVKKSY